VRLVFQWMRTSLPLAALLLGACSAQPSASNSSIAASGGVAAANAVEPPPPAAPAETKGTPEPTPSPVKSEAPTSAPTSTARAVVSEAPFTDKSAQGAANVVQTYFALIEAKKYDEAYALWQGRSGLTPAAFAAQFARYRSYHAEVYKPGQIEGAAGSSYVEIPIKTYGVTARGEKFEEPGVVTLRRVNDVDGSTAAQRRWHIERIDTPPSPH